LTVNDIQISMLFDATSSCIVIETQFKMSRGSFLKYYKQTLKYDFRINRTKIFLNTTANCIKVSQLSVQGHNATTNLSQVLTRGGRSHMFEIRLRSCSKIFESGSGSKIFKLKNPTRLQTPDTIDATKIQQCFT